MKIIAVFICATLIMGANCKKNPPIIPEDLVIKTLTDGEWSVTDYKLNGTNLTADFAGRRFKYYANKTIEAKLNGNVTNTGTWDGSQSSMTSSVTFPGAVNPIALVTGTWTFIPTSTRIVDAAQTVGTDVKTMKLYRE